MSASTNLPSSSLSLPWELLLVLNRAEYAHNTSHGSLWGRNADFLPGSPLVENILGVTEKAELSHGELWILGETFQMNFVLLECNCLYVFEMKNLFCADFPVLKAHVSLK